MKHNLDISDFDFERPPFIDSERMEHADYLAPSIVFGGMSVGLYRNSSKLLDVSEVIPAAPVHMIPVQFLKGPAVNAWRDGKHLALPINRAGSIRYFDMRFRWQVELGFPFHNLHFYIPQKSFDDFSYEFHKPQIPELSLSPSEPLSDPVIYHLARALAFLMESPSEPPRLLTDQILCAVRSRLAFRYGGITQPAAPPAKLSDGQVRRLKSLLQDDLGHSVSLDELAEACGLPVNAFRRAFKARFGQSPHRWRLLQKVERARRLIEYSDATLAEISAGCGFSDQSHLTRLFTRTIGTPPAAYRRMRRR